MRNAYHAAFLATALVLLITIIQSYSSKKNIAVTLRKLLISAIVATLANTVVVVSLSEALCMMAYSVFFVAIDWVMYYLMHFVMQYTNSKNMLDKGPRFFRVILLMDSASMLANYFFHHAFMCREVKAADGEVFYRLTYSWPYNVHLVVSYFLVLLAVTSLLYKIKKSPQVYRSKYISVFIVFLFVVVADAVYVFFGGVIDVSVIGFAVAGVLVYYMAVIYVPRDVVDRLLSMVVQDMVDGVLLFDMDGNCIHINESAIKFLQPEERDQPEVFCEKWYREELEKNKGNDGRDVVVRLAGEPVYLRVYLQTILDESGAQIGAFINIKNRTQEVNSLAAERYRATHDPLTGLYNKEFFYEQVRQTLTDNADEKYLLICSDIGNFKMVNDVFGTGCGDKVLIRISKSLRKLTQPGQIYGRIDNDGFALLMKKVDYDENYFRTVPQAQVYVEHNIEYPIRLYLGVYEIKNKELPVSVMCDRAKMAIETIKGNYQERLAYYDEKLRESVLLEQQMMSDFDEAIEQGQFQIYLQPQVNGMGEVHGAEALVRWIHPTKGYMPPSEFIDIFEKNGTIVRLDQHVWELACRKLKEWKDEGQTDWYLSVNISPKDFYFVDVYEAITSLVKKYEISPKNLHLEVTETSMMTEIQQRIQMIEKLQKFGFVVEMDDFGSGYSSLNMLKDIHVDVLKVDMVFLEKTTEVERSKKILRTVIALAQELDMVAIVEGVETKEQLMFLKSINCDMFQGYFFAKPMEVLQFEEIYMKKQ